MAHPKITPYFPHTPKYGAAAIRQNPRNPAIQEILYVILIPHFAANNAQGISSNMADKLIREEENMLKDSLPPSMVRKRRISAPFSTTWEEMQPSRVETIAVLRQERLFSSDKVSAKGTV